MKSNVLIRLTSTDAGIRKFVVIFVCCTVLDAGVVMIGSHLLLLNIINQAMTLSSQ